MTNHIVLNCRRPWCHRVVGLKYKTAKGRLMATGFNYDEKYVWLEEQEDRTFHSVAALEGIYEACTDNPGIIFIFARPDICWQVGAPHVDYNWRIENYQRKYNFPNVTVAWQMLWARLFSMLKEGPTPTIKEGFKIHWSASERRPLPDLSNVDVSGL